MEAITLEIDLRVYRLSAVKKALYRLGRRYVGTITLLEADRASVVLYQTPDAPPGDADHARTALLREVLDQELREHIADETGAIRNILVAQAFSKTSLFDDEAEPKGE